MEGIILSTFLKNNPIFSSLFLTLPEGACFARIPAEGECTALGQCADHAECSMDTDLNKEICKCMADFYALNGQCWPTVDAGKPCTGWGQCVPNAQCSTDRGGTCDCSEDFYQNRTRCLESKI